MYNNEYLPWTTERREQLRGLWDEGVPVATIARLIGGTTKNAVVGIVRRMGLVPRASPIKGVRKPKPLMLNLPRITYGAKGTHGGGAVLLGPTLELLGVVKPGLEVPPPAPIGVRGEENTGCRWPLWADKERPSHRFCGDATLTGKSYCHGHHAIAYVPSRDLRDTVVTEAQAAHLRALHAKQAARTPLTLWSAT